MMARLPYPSTIGLPPSTAEVAELIREAAALGVARHAHVAARLHLPLSTVSTLVARAKADGHLTDDDVRVLR